MELWDNLLEKFRGPIEFQTQKRGEQIQAEIDYYNTPEGQRAAQIGGEIMLGMLPIPGSRFFGINRVTMPLINKTYGAVGKDMVGRAPLPVSKTPVQTARGPRGPINVDSSKQLPLPLKGGRNTGGLSETDKAMIDFIKPTVIGNKRFTGPPEHKHAIDQVPDIGSGKYRVNKPLNKDRYPRKSDRILNRRPANAQEVEIIKDLTKKGFYNKPKSDLNRLRSEGPFYPLKAKNVPEALTKATLNRGRPYPGPHLTAQEGSKRLIPLRKTGKAREASWYQDPKTGDLYQYHYGTGSLARGFYKRGANAQDTPKYARRAQQEFNKPKGIMNTPPAKSSLSKVKSTNIKELTNRRNALRSETFRLNSMRSQGEATQADMNKLFRIQEELEAINKLLK